MEKEITKDKFKALYFRHASAGDGWTLAYWNQFFEDEQGGRYFYEKPESPKATRMFIISDQQRHRMVFLSEEGEEALFDFPGKE